MTKVLMVASEASPFAKTGGLADVLGALPAALNACGDDVAVLLPRYGAMPIHSAKRVSDFPIWMGGKWYDAALLRIDKGAAYYFLDCPSLYARNGYYNDADGDFPDNHVRFALLSRAALEISRRVFRPGVIHCHDWQAGLVAAYLKGRYSSDPTFAGIKTLFTIHNLGYPGRFLPEIMPEVDLDASQYGVHGVEFLRDVSYLKAGLYYSDELSTVSPTYAQEIQTPEQGFGFDGLLRSRARSLVGILNGVDYSEWDPQVDKYIAAKYSADKLAGKRACKLDLMREMGLSNEAAGRPLIGIISRFATQKGLDLIETIAHDLMRLDISLAVLGNGEPAYEEMFLSLAKEFPKRVATRIGYDLKLSHKIEAGADMFLMPSRYEPCGLNQIYSLRYGAVPVVRATGGLDDTIDESTGFKFREYSAAALLSAIRTAVDSYADPVGWTARMQRGMRMDYSWLASAKRYSGLYGSLTGSV